jgi:hypothetical protein
MGGGEEKREFEEITRCEAVKMVHFTAAFLTLIKSNCSKNPCTSRLVHATVLKKPFM